MSDEDDRMNIMLRREALQKHAALQAALQRFRLATHDDLTQLRDDLRLRFRDLRGRIALRSPLRTHPLAVLAAAFLLGIVLGMRSRRKHGAVPTTTALALQRTRTRK